MGEDRGHLDNNQGGGGLVLLAIEVTAVSEDNVPVPGEGLSRTACNA